MSPASQHAALTPRDRSPPIGSFRTLSLPPLSGPCGSNYKLRTACALVVKRGPLFEVPNKNTKRAYSVEVLYPLCPYFLAPNIHILMTLMSARSLAPITNQQPAACQSVICEGKCRVVVVKLIQNAIINHIPSFSAHRLMTICSHHRSKLSPSSAGNKSRFPLLSKCKS